MEGVSTLDLGPGAAGLPLGLRNLTYCSTVMVYAPLNTVSWPNWYPRKQTPSSPQTPGVPGSPREMARGTRHSLGEGTPYTTAGARTPYTARVIRLTLFAKAMK